MSAALLPMPPYIWFENIWRDFVRQLERNMLLHAILLSGIDGIGANDMALAMGQYLLCLSPTDHIVCGKCKGCQLLDSGGHPDLTFVSPEEKGKQIKIDQIREVAETVAKTAQQGGRKVIIIAPAESMNVNASNALLKSLEEPAGDTTFILVSNELSRLMPTIRSRCTKVVLKMPTLQQGREWLEGREVENAEQILLEANGAPLKAADWLDSGFLEERETLFKGFVSLSEGITPPMALAGQWSNRDANGILECTLFWVDLIIKNKMGGDANPIYTTLVEAVEHVSCQLLFRYRERLCIKKAKLAGSYNLNPALFIEELLLDWHAVVKSRSTHR